jgi:hypothetical protein
MPYFWSFLVVAILAADGAFMVDGDHLCPGPNEGN